VLRPRHQHALFAGDEVAGHSGFGQAVAYFHRQQAQRGEVDTGFGALQHLQGLIGLAGIGGAQMEMDTPIQRTGERKGRRVVVQIELDGESVRRDGGLG
jgi:hypothetical protein